MQGTPTDNSSSSNIAVKLIEQSRDARSDEIAYELNLKNSRLQTIHISSLRPRIPDGAQLSDIYDLSQIDIETNFRQTCKDLSALASSHLFQSVNSYREQFRKIVLDDIKELDNSLQITLIFRLYYKLMTSYASSSIARQRLPYSALSYTIETVDDVEYMRSLIASAIGINTDIKQIFEAKIQRLKSLDIKRLNNNSETTITVDPNGTYTTTFVFQFPRGSINVRRYNIAIDVMYYDAEKAKQYSASASTSLIITPRPWILSMIAIASAPLGVFIRNFMEISKQGTKNTIANIDLSDLLSLGEIFAACILALIFFNIYEYTGFSKKVSLSLGWRAALFLGFASGLASDRILLAIEALLGKG